MDQLSSEVGPPNTVAHVVPANMVAVQYFDEYGKAHSTVLLKVGGMVYHAPNGEQWAGALRPASGWLAEKVKTVMDSKDAPLPVTDAVDVIGTQVAKAIK